MIVINGKRMDDGVDEPDRCPVCGEYEPCDHNFDQMGEQLESIGASMGTFGKYRKKPVVIDACVWNGRNIGDMMDLSASGATRRQKPTHLRFDAGKLKIETLEGEMTAEIGDWLICGVQGELYPCKPEIFDATYESFNL